MLWIVEVSIRISWIYLCPNTVTMERANRRWQRTDNKFLFVSIDLTRFRPRKQVLDVSFGILDVEKTYHLVLVGIQPPPLGCPVFVNQHLSATTRAPVFYHYVLISHIRNRNLLLSFCDVTNVRNLQGPNDHLWPAENTADSCTDVGWAWLGTRI